MPIEKHAVFTLQGHIELQQSSAFEGTTACKQSWLW